jgi:hypothetical protein
MSEKRINVYGGFPARIGLQAVGSALMVRFHEAKVYIVDLGEGLGKTLHFRTEKVFFGSLFMDEEDNYLFDGSVEGTLEDAITVVGSISECLAAANLDHDFSVHDAPDRCVASFIYPPEEINAESGAAPDRPRD